MAAAVDAGPPAAAPLRPLAGRQAELSELGDLLAAAFHGYAPTVVLSGEAGVGKTSLVRGLLAEVPAGTVVLSGGCLPMPSLSVGLLPLRSALRSAGISGPRSAACLRAIEEGRPVEGLDAYLNAMTEEGLVVVFVDDIQWADQSTLDLLLYLAAASRGPGYAVIVTVRTDDVSRDHPLDPWLANVLRLPNVVHRVLGPLDRDGTEAQLAGLLGALPHQSLVEDTFARARGNPYFTGLLARGIDPAARHLPATLPGDLVIAVGRLWQSLPARTREVSSLLAVVGRPTSARVLAEVVAATGLDDVRRALDLAEAAGLIELRDLDDYWFRHPLQAEVMMSLTPPGRRRQWHRAFADHLQASFSAESRPTAEQAATLVDHYDRAGELGSAYAWALKFRELAHGRSGSSELIAVLQRAVELRTQLPDAAESVEVLLLDLVRAAARAGVEPAELAAIEQLLQRTDPSAHPLLVSELLLRRMHLTMSTGAGFPSSTEARHAANLASADPESWQYAFALAEVAHFRAWEGDTDVTDQAARALEIARRAGHPGALAYALVADSMVKLDGGDRATAFVEAAEAADLAAQAGDWWGFVHAVMWQSNAEVSLASQDGLRHLRERREQLAALGAPHAHLARICVVEAGERLAAGDWEGCEASLRSTLASDPGPHADVQARLTAAQLSAWQGRVAQARAHLTRAEELVTDPERYRNYAFEAVRATVLLEEHRPAEAFQTALAAAERPGVPPHWGEWLVPSACRALADQAEDTRDAGADPAAVLCTLETFLGDHPALLTEPGEATPEELERRHALELWRDAEVARARRGPEAALLWADTVSAAVPARLRWLEAYALWRRAEVLLGARGHQDPAGVHALRRAYVVAVQQSAAAILREIVALSSSARVRLTDDDGSAYAPERVPGLTAREREILSHLVTGATYAQIAQALVISDKTVSSHVSSMLRKTGTTGRVQLAQLARRRTGDVAPSVLSGR